MFELFFFSFYSFFDGINYASTICLKPIRKMRYACGFGDDGLLMSQEKNRFLLIFVQFPSPFIKAFVHYTLSYTPS